jgi:hypothetical protein
MTSEDYQREPPVRPGAGGGRTNDVSDYGPVARGVSNGTPGCGRRGGRRTSHGHRAERLAVTEGPGLKRRVARPGATCWANDQLPGQASAEPLNLWATTVCA